MTTAAGSTPPGLVRTMLENFYRQQKIDQHQADIKAWPWWARFLHRWLRSWGCEACKAHREQERRIDSGKASP